MSTSKKKILFLCTGNSCRSQIAEGWARYLKGNEFEVYSAGVEKHGLNPYAVQVMKESGVDISKHYSKLTSELKGIEFDFVITVCGHANENCPFFPGKTKVIHVGFEDPRNLPKNTKKKKTNLTVTEKSGTKSAVSFWNCPYYCTVDKLTNIRSVVSLSGD